MKHIILILLCCWHLPLMAQFVHPGLLHSKADLDNLRLRVQSGQEPWKTAWQQLQNSDLAQLSVKPSVVSHISNGSYNLPDNGGSEFYDDGNIAYTMALQWYVTGNKKYAQKAIEFLNAWSYGLDSVTNHNRQLKVGVAGAKYLNAAEIIKHTYKGWAQKDQKAFEKMILDVWYPVIVDFVPRYNGNWDAAIGHTMLAMGIYLDRQDIFDRAYNHLLKGETNGAINWYFSETGQCQESGRDQHHTQMGMGYLACACEMAWNQGLDLYGAYENRLLKGYEYTAKYMNGEEVPYVQYVTFYGGTVFGTSISSGNRSQFLPIFEIAYRHYHGRKGLDMPFTWKSITKTRNETVSAGFMPWGTLVFAGGQ